MASKKLTITEITLLANLLAREISEIRFLNKDDIDKARRLETLLMKLDNV